MLERTEPAAMGRLTAAAKEMYKRDQNLGTPPNNASTDKEWYAWLDKVLGSLDAMLYVVSQLPSWWHNKGEAMLKGNLKASQNVTACTISPSTAEVIDPEATIFAQKSGQNIYAAGATLERGALFP